MENQNHPTHANQSDAESLSRQAREHLSAGHWEEAVVLYQRALAADAERTDDWVNQGLALWSLQRHEAALECYDHALALEPNHVLA